MNKARFGTDFTTLQFEFTPQLPCNTCTKKCRTRPGRDSEVPEQVKPLDTPEEREKTRARYRKRFPEPPTEAEVTLGSTFAFERPQSEENQEEGPTTEQVIDKARGIHRAADTRNAIAESVETRFKAIQGEKLISSSEEHTRAMRAERLEEWTQARLRGRRR